MAYTLRAAARKIGVAVTTIQNWIANGALYEVPVVGGVRLVSDESVDRKLRERAGVALEPEPAAPAVEEVVP